MFYKFSLTALLLFAAAPAMSDPLFKVDVYASNNQLSETPKGLIGRFDLESLPYTLGAHRAFEEFELYERPARYHGVGTLEVKKTGPVGFTLSVEVPPLLTWAHIPAKYVEPKIAPGLNTRFDPYSGPLQRERRANRLVPKQLTRSAHMLCKMQVFIAGKEILGLETMAQYESTALPQEAYIPAQDIRCGYPAYTVETKKLKKGRHKLEFTARCESLREFTSFAHASDVHITKAPECASQTLLGSLDAYPGNQVRWNLLVRQPGEKVPKPLSLPTPEDELINE